jgi:hypothetical protein
MLTIVFAFLQQLLGKNGGGRRAPPAISYGMRTRVLNAESSSNKPFFATLKCWSNAIMRADEYDPLVEELSQRLGEEMEKGLTDLLTDLIRLLNLFRHLLQQGGLQARPPNDPSPHV